MSSRAAKNMVLWAACAVPLVGVVELVVHARQTASVVTDADWEAARDVVKADFKPGDLVVFAPFWADPNGRRWFGDALAPLKNEARPDVTRYARVFEVSIRGKHDEELEGWKKTSERAAGRVTVSLFENPSPAKVRTDLLDLVGPESLRVSLLGPNGGETACTFQRGQGSPGGLSVPQGPAIPGDRFACSGGAYVGAAVLHAIDHHPHLCIFATSTGGAALRLRFANVTFAESLHGHAGIQWVTDRVPSAERVSLAFSAFERPIGTHSHRVGTGWTGFEFPTAELVGKRGELVAEVVDAGGAGKQFCFEADTR